MPSRDRIVSHTELLTSTAFHNHNHLQRAHAFGCDVFVLDPRLQDSKKILKWSMRSKRGIYLGVSPFNSSTVHLVLNPATRSITPQYHLVFDDIFSTVFSNGQFDPSIWTNLLFHGYKLHATIQPHSTGFITIPPDCAPFDASSTPLSSSEGAATDEAVQHPTIQPPNAPDVLDTDLTVPDSPLSLDPADHLHSPSPLSFTEGVTVTDHPPLSPTEEASAFTPAPHRS